MTSLITLMTLLSTSAFAGTIYDISLKDINGKMTSLQEFKGKVILVVNTASQCGYTPQYAGLEKLYQKYKNKNFVIAAFPSNDFGGQEPGTNAEIKKFCELKYKTTFQFYEKNPVLGKNKQPLYQYLISNSKPSDEIGWNFEKFIIDKSGRIAHRFKSSVEPESSTLTHAIETEL